MMPCFSARTTRIGTRILVSTLALATANAAQAQVTGGGNSYDAGNPVVVSGNVTFDRQGTANTETYTINSSTAVLDFIPNDTGPGGPINFQLAGTLAQYLGGLGITDFTVLNRILANDPSRAIQLNGTIISRLQASPTTPGGSVWFYSPGGIIVGSSAVIDVGNLLLATGDPTGGTGTIADPNQFTINSVPNSNAAVTVQAGAQITASNPGSYIALVAPAITQSGTVSTNGSAAYVAAEQTTLTFNSGLFNIQTTVGSNANNNTPFVHNGTTRFIDDSGQRRVYLVAVAKNDAITMLIQGAGQLGFDTATGVNVDNGVVVLSGGYDVTDTTYSNLAGSAGTLRHDIQITNPTNNANFLGQVNPFAASEIRINAAGQAMNFAGDVSMNAGSLAAIVAGTSGSVNIAGDLDLSTLVYGLRDADFSGGNVVLDASAGNITIGGNSSLTSFTNADFLGGADPAGTVTGGNVIIIADNAHTINMVGSLDVLVEANGADQLLVSQTSAGNAMGGSILLSSAGGSSISVGGAANIVSTANGGTVQLGNATAGNATGGITNIFAVDGDITFSGDLSVSARGNGGQVNASGTTTAGDGTGGQINFTVGASALSVAGNLTADVSGFGGSTQFATSRSGGDGTGGSIVMSGIGTGSINIGNNFFAAADGLGSAAVGSGNNGGSGTGGLVEILSQSGTMNFGGNVSLAAYGRGESGADNIGVVARGGTLNLQAGGGAISVAGNLDMFAQGGAQAAGAGQDGADAIGGSSIASATSGGALDIGGTAVVSASAVGGNSNGGTNGEAGDGQGGNAQFVATGNGILTIGMGATASAVGIGGNGLVAGSDAGNGSGGTASFSQDTGGLIDIAVPGGQSAVITTDGIGGTSTGGGGIGGNGTGGDSRFVSNDGTIILNGNLFVSAQGQGGAGDGSTGGTGTGGLANIGADTGLTRVTGNATIRSAGIGGAGLGTGTNGGAGIGGQSLIGSIGTGAIDLQGSVTFNDDSTGGTAVSGTGGDGTGGVSQIFATAGTVDVGGFAQFNSNGNGGGGLNGGIGTGGRASIFAESAGTINFADQVQMTTQGRGGQSDGVENRGGFGQGGTAEIFAHGTINIAGDYFANSGGIGGQGANGADGGDALGGVGTIIADGGAIRFDAGARTRGTTNGGSVISGNGSGGNAQGGLAEMIARNGGSLQILGLGGAGAGDANVATSAFGGNGLFGSGSGGNAIGGISNIIAESGGTINIAGRIIATASGFGGGYFFDPALEYADRGGNGVGGTVNIVADGGDIIGTSDVSVFTNGTGGLGVVDGGTGTGGTINIVAIEGLLDFSAGTSAMNVNATGIGGDAVVETDGAGNVLRGGGNGGDGIGGNIFLIAGTMGAGAGLTGTIRTGDISTSQNGGGQFAGIGGAGAAGATGQDGGDGGDGVAGVVRIGTNNGSSRFTAGNITVDNIATGGIGGDGENGGDGGDAAGRQTAIGTFAELGASSTGSMSVGNITANGSAFGGNGGTGLNGNGGSGGDSLVGAPDLLTSQASTYLISRPSAFFFGDALLTMDSTGGDGGIGSSGRAAGGTAAGFGASIISTRGTDNIGPNGQVFGNSFSAQAISTGGLGADDVRAASNRGFVTLNGVGGNITLASATLIDGGLSAHQNGIFSAIESGDGFVFVDGLVNVDVDGDFGLLGYAGGDIDLAAINLTAGGTILFDDPNAPGSTVPDVLTIDEVNAVLGGDFIFADDIELGGNFNLTAGGRIQAGGILSGGAIALQAGGSITTGDLLAVGNISLTGIGDGVSGLPANIQAGNISTQAGLINVVTDIGNITLGNLNAPNGITINAGNFSTSPVAGGDIVVGTVQASDLDIRGTDNLAIGNITVADGVALTLTGDINAADISAGNAVNLNSGLGNITAGAVQSTDGTVQVMAGLGSVQTAAISAGNSITVEGASAISISGDATAGQSASFTTDGTATFDGLVSANNIRVTSSDITIGTNGGLGGTNTDDLEINALGAGQPIVFGGDGSSGGYNLSAMEASRLRARTIQFNAQQVSSGQSADITIADFTMQGSLAGSSANLLGSDLFFNTPGNIRVTGAIRIENAGAEDGLFLSAGSSRIEVVTDMGGSIAMLDGSGGLGGNLYLAADHIAIGTAELLGRLAENPRFAGRDAAVNAPDGSNRPEGYISANRIQANAFETIIIQNSGTDVLRGGFSAGSGGFVLAGEDLASGAVDVVINGRIASDNGAFLTNNDTLAGVRFEPPLTAAQFSAGSTVNGCLLNGGGCPVVETPTVPEPPTPEQPSTPDEGIGTIASDVREIIQEQDDAPEQEEEERAAELTPESTGKKSPIAPNIPVVNTSRLNRLPTVSDPITGSGNPNLIGGDLDITPDQLSGPASDGDS